MEDNNKINRRSRPRPYDLRRKVLLKNFLREQMTYIPLTRFSPSVQSSDTNFSVKTSTSPELDEDLKELNDENSASSVSVDNSTSSTNIEENNLVPEINVDETDNNITDSTAKAVNTSDAPVPESKFFRFSSIMNLRSYSRKKKMKGIIKAKRACKVVKSPIKSKAFKTGLERLLSGRSRTSKERSSDRTTRSSSKSLFSLFKSRKEQRKAKGVERTTQSSSTDVKSTSSVEIEKNYYTSNRSVQTDDSWARQELSKVQQSNKLLREENRLLSESLTYFMSSNSLDSQMNRCGSPLQSSNRNVNGMQRYPGCYDNLSSCSTYGYDDNNNWNPRSRVLRSKSMQEHGDRGNSPRYTYRTRSMNYHNTRSEFYPESTPTASSYSSSSHAPPQYIIPRIRRKHILTNLPVNSTGKVVQRRSSMPERILSENDRSRVCRRSGSVRDTRTPFHSLPAEAFY